MQGHEFVLAGAELVARATGALWWPAERCLVVSDLHFGKAARLARRNGALLPPYDTSSTLARLDAEIAALDPAEVICLGDSFDDLEAADLPDAESLWLTRLMAGRHWVWIAGNHDPGPVALGGSHRDDVARGPIRFCHIAKAGTEAGEISGHYHPKARLGGVSRPCFLLDARRAILPAFGTYTGGLSASDPVLAALMLPNALAVLTGARALAMPMPRLREGRTS
ncbi:ligase-associated DNA damage response endonuclease PdeM [Phaeovulum sp.]|uniref:ligase-associated DNA damage response endonuclease PdeM n=1 Tax=Phaeovulum sp. TaxID=2934796 RepID=UPI003561BFA7